MIAWFVRNSVAANLLMITIALAGLYSLYNTPIEIFPRSTPDVVTIAVPLRGATPEDMELGVAARVEEAIQGLEGIDRIVSESREGSARVNVEIDSAYEPRALLDDIKGRVDSISTFPAEAEKPVISLSQFGFGVISVVVSGSHDEDEVRVFAERVRDDLLRIEGISQVSLDAVRDYEIAIEASQDRLREFGLRLADVAAAVRGSSADLSAGNVRTAGGDVLIRSKGQAYRRTDFENIVLKTNPDGSIIRVGDVATVIDGFQEDAVSTTFNGRRAALIEVDRVGNESALEIARQVKAYIDAQQASLPAGMTLGYWDDDSQQLKNRLGLLGSSAVQGSLLVLLLLTLFLRPTIAFWVFMGIPVSILGAFALMPLFDVSLNLMSAFGFIVVLGILVDDAIVTGESIYQRLQSGMSGTEAAIRGTQDVAVPVTFGVLTTLASFLPLMFVEGHFGRVMGPVATVVLCVLVLSLIESKFVLPAHLKHLDPAKEQARVRGRLSQWQQRFASGFEAAVLRYYAPLLEVALRHRYSVFAGFIGMLVLVFALVASGWTRFVFMPSIEGETVTVTLEMPVGTQFEVTDRHVQRILEAAQAIGREMAAEDGEVVRNVLATTGSAFGSGAAPHFGRVQVELVPPESRTGDVSTADVIRAWRERIGTVPGAESLTFRSNFLRAGDPIDVQFSGDSLVTLAAVAAQLRAHLDTYPTVYEITDSMSDGKEEMRVELKPQGHVLGMTRTDVLGQVSQAFKGFEVQRIQRGRDDIRVLVRLPREERSSFATLGEMTITSPSGRQVPLEHVAELLPARGPSEIKRIDGFRTVNVTAEVDKARTNMTVVQAELAAYLDRLVAQYPGVRYEFQGEARQQRESFGSLGTGLLLVLFAIYVLLALPLRSYTQPLVVMAVIPFGIVGAVLGHWIMGFSLSLLSVMGMLALTGVAVNDALVLVDYVNKRRAEGADVEDAVRSAGVARFRAVMLTSATTFIGLAPILLERSTTGQFLIPMAISLGFGVLFATFVTLLLVPVNVLIGRDIRRGLRRLLGRPAPVVGGTPVTETPVA